MTAYRWRQVAVGIVRCDATKVYGRLLGEPRRVEVIKCKCGKPATLAVGVNAGTVMVAAYTCREHAG